MALDLVPSFAGGVKKGYFSHNPPFDVLPFSEADFETLIKNYGSTRSAYINGGLAQKGDFLLAKTALMEALDELAKQTDIKADGNPDIIMLACFNPTQVGNGEVNKPGQPVVNVKRGIAGELISSCEKLPEAKHYGCIMTEGAPLPNGVYIDEGGKLIIGNIPLTNVQFDFSDQRKKHFANLKPGVTYYFYYYAVNLSGVSPLSVVVSLMCV